MSESSNPAELLFTELVDAVRFSQSWRRILDEQEELKEGAAKQTQELDGLKSEISRVLDQVQLDPEDSKALSKKVNEFASLAIKQTKERIDVKLKAELERSSSQSASEELKAKKSLESYLASTPLPIIDEQVTIALSNGSYSALAEYRCAGEIEYEFLLNTAVSKLLRSELTFADLEKGVRLPVRLGKAWLRKEPVPDFEKLDGYSLSKARASKNHLTATFLNQETHGQVDLVFSRSGADSFVTIEYSGDGLKIDITGEAGLSKHVDLVSVKNAAGVLTDAIVELKDQKLRLAKLEAGGTDIIATLDCLGFARRAVEVIIQSKESMAEIRKIDPKLALERLKLLGPSGSAFIGILGLRGPKS